jgi:nitrate reductase delta subunit
MGTLTMLAEALRYPTCDCLKTLQSSRSGIPPGEVKESFEAFLERVQELSLGEWEELYTRTWDLDPIIFPYVGYQTWGENYRRGNFMSRLNRALVKAGVDTDGELPDHLVPVLRYLDTVSLPLPELVEIFEPALQKMLTTLRKVEASNSYILWLEAVQASWKLAQNYPAQQAGSG